MAARLKDSYNQAYIAKLAEQVLSVYPGFCCAAFQASIFDNKWSDKALKARMGTITQALHQFLPEKFQQSVHILQQIAPQFSGYEALFFPDFVEKYGLDNYQSSVQALAYLTRYASAEFAVRAFIVKYPQKMMAQLFIWSQSENEHLRRLASEGCRPRLPWAVALSEFKKNPQAVLIILEQLKNDPSEYVRRSVANNLNDISKDNPDIVIKVAKNWLLQKAHTDINRQRLVKHACRSLLKQANPTVLSLFAFNIRKDIKISAFTVDKEITIGDKLSFSFALTSNKKLGKLRIEFAIDFMKKNGRLADKIFHLSESTLNITHKKMAKKFDFKIISTRKYYSGKHYLTIIINGQAVAKEAFILK